MSDESWLLDLGVGDQVFINTRWSGLHLLTVDRVTATQIVCGEDRYRRKDGRRIGDHSPWDVVWLQRPTIELQKQYEHKKALAYVKSIPWSTLPPATVVALATVIRVEIERKTPK